MAPLPALPKPIRRSRCVGVSRTQATAEQEIAGTAPGVEPVVDLEPQRATELISEVRSQIDVTAARVGQKVASLLRGLDVSLVERKREVRVALLALLAGHHVLLLGAPGTGKSLLARGLVRCFRDARYFECLLSANTHPDELFGPLSLPALKAEEYRRVTDGYLPAAHVAFLDEIFNASGAVLHALLGLVNERVFHNGRRREEVPLLGLIAASNEMPADHDIAPLLDRLLVRIELGAVRCDEGFLRVCLGDCETFMPAASDRITLNEVAHVRHAAGSVGLTLEARGALLRVRARLTEAGISPSDRRWRWALDLLRVAAITSGRRQVVPLDLLLLDTCLATHPSEQPAVDTALRGVVDVAPEHDHCVESAWADLGSSGATASTLSSALAERRAAVDDFRRVLDGVASDLDSHRSELAHLVESCPWLSESPSVVLGQLVTLRRRIVRLRRANQKQLQWLGAFDWMRWALAQIGDASADAEQSGGEPAFWFAPRGAPRTEWMPVLADGSTPRCVCPEWIERANARAAAAEAGSGLEWHDAVHSIEIDAAELFDLASRRTDVVPVARRMRIAVAAGSVAELNAVPAGYLAVDAFIAAVQALRKAGVARLPRPAVEDQ